VKATEDRVNRSVSRVCKVRKPVTVLSVIVVTTCRLLNKPINNLNGVFSRQNTLQYVPRQRTFIQQDVPRQRTFTQQDFSRQQTFIEGYPVSGVTLLLTGKYTTSTANAMQSWIICQGIKGERCLSSSQGSKTFVLMSVRKSKPLSLDSPCPLVV
jgi:hypothetical protein